MRKSLLLFVLLIVFAAHGEAYDLQVYSSEITADSYVLYLKAADSPDGIVCCFYSRKSEQQPRVLFFFDEEYKSFAEDFMILKVSGYEYENMIFRWEGSEKYYYVLNQDTFIDMLETTLISGTSLWIISKVVVEGVVDRDPEDQVIHIHLGEDALIALTDLNLFVQYVY